MIYGIIYTIVAIICLGVILYIYDLEFGDSEALLAILISILWIISLPIIILLGLGYGVKLLLNKIFEK
jgi:hypothetical protein